MQLSYHILTIATALCISTITHALDLSWSDPNNKKKYQIIFNNNANLGKKSSQFDTLPNEVAKNVFDRCSKKDRHNIRLVTQNLSKRIIVFFDGRLDRNEKTWGPEFYLETHRPGDFWRYIYSKIIPWYEHADIPAQLINTCTEKLCASMAAGRLQLGGYIPVMKYDQQGVEILAKSLKHQRCIHIIYHEYNAIMTPQNNIKIMFNTLAKESQVEDLKLNALQFDNNVIPEFVNFLSHNTTLKKLDLSSNTITDKGIKVLAENIKNNTRLQELNFDSAFNISPTGKRCLIEAFHKENRVDDTVEVVTDTHSRRLVADPVTKRKLYLKLDDTVSGIRVLPGLILLGNQD